MLTKRINRYVYAFTCTSVAMIFIFAILAPAKIGQRDGAEDGTSPVEAFIKVKKKEVLLEYTFSQRRQLVAKVCADHVLKRKDVPPGQFPVDRISYRTLLVDDKHKLIYCSVPKVASTTMKKLLTAMNAPERFASPDAISDEEVNDGNVTWPYLKRLSDFNLTEAWRRLATYTTLMWVRDPLERLASCWRSKFKKKTRFYSEVFGSYMIKTYRKNASIEEITRGYPVSLTEFFSYLRDEGSHRADVHWEYYYDLCMTCDINYDYIGHQENFDQEASYLLSKIGGTAIGDRIRWSLSSRSNPSTASASTTHQTKDDLKDVPPKLVSYVASQYAIDYAMFGYQVPSYYLQSTSST